MGLFRKNKFPHIKYGFRGEGILYQLGNKQLEIWSTWIDGRRIYLDDITGGQQLNKEQKESLLREIVEFTNWNKEKPIIVYTNDSHDAKLWRTLCMELCDSIKSVETSATEENELEQYNFMKAELETGRATFNVDGRILKSIKDLDKYWNSKRK